MGVSREYANQLELVVLVTWLLKDLGWVLLLAPLVWPAALAAICLEFHGTMMEWKTDSAAIRVHGVATLLWIIGNATWMTSEFLWDSSSCCDKEGKHSIFPWHSGPLAGKQEKAYWTGVMCARALFSLGLITLSAFYTRAAYDWNFGSPTPKPVHTSSSNPQDEMDEPPSVAVHTTTELDAEPLVWGIITPKVYMVVFIGPWLLKDFFWTLDLFIPALISGVIVLALVLDAYRRYSSPTSLVESTWVVGNIIWLTSELALATPNLAVRVVAASFMAVGIGLAVRAIVQVRLQITSEEPSEDSALLGARS